MAARRFTEHFPRSFGSSWEPAGFETPRLVELLPLRESLTSLAFKLRIPISCDCIEKPEQISSISSAFLLNDAYRK